MPCPHSQSSSTSEEDRGIERREFVKAAVAIGGVNALASVRARAHGDDDEHHDEAPTGTDDVDSLPGRQYAWDEFSERNMMTGLAEPPNHHVQFMLDYAGEGTPTDEEREEVEATLRMLERAYEWSHEGLLFTIGYSPAYFDRYDEVLPEDTGLRPPEDIIEETDVQHSGRIEADDYDAHLHMASDNAVALLEAEEALFGNVDEANGVSVEATLDGVFEKRDRRTGFIGNPQEKWDEDLNGRNPVGEDSPLWFGFMSVFEDSQPSEDFVAIDDPEHPFHDGTTEQVSVLRDNGLKNWYNKDHEERVERMFSPHHSSDDTGQHGHKLAMEGDGTSGTDEESMAEIATRTEEDAEELGVVGHSQKTARARTEEGVPPIIRRDVPSTDGNKAHTQFISNQREIEDFIDVRRAMAFVDPDDESADSEVPNKDHGIQGHFTVQSRGTFLLPPRSLRALPPANP